MHEITVGHRSLSGTISCVTDRIRFLPLTMTGRFSNFNSMSYTEDRHELRVTGTKCRLPDTMSGTDKISILGAEVRVNYLDDNINTVFLLFSSKLRSKGNCVCNFGFKSLKSLVGFKLQIPSMTQKVGEFSSLSSSFSRTFLVGISES